MKQKTTNIRYECVHIDKNVFKQKDRGHTAHISKKRVGQSIAFWDLVCNNLRWVPHLLFALSKNASCFLAISGPLLRVFLLSQGPYTSPSVLSLILSAASKIKDINCWMKWRVSVSPFVFSVYPSTLLPSGQFMHGGRGVYLPLTLTPTEEEFMQKRRQRSSLLFGEGIYSIPCHTKDLAPGWWEEMN